MVAEIQTEWRTIVITTRDRRRDCASFRKLLLQTGKMRITKDDKKMITKSVGSYIAPPVSQKKFQAQKKNNSSRILERKKRQKTARFQCIERRERD